MKVKVLFKVGGRGCTVSLVKRSDSPYLYLRWWDNSLRKGKGDYIYESLKHEDRGEGEAAALDASAILRRGKRPGKEKVLALAALLGAYELHKTAKKKERQQKTDRWRMDYFLDFYGAQREALSIDVDALDGYVEHRRAEGAGDTTIGHEIVFLRGVMTWATTKRGADGKPLMLYNPLAGAKRIRSAEPNTPIADARAFAAIYRYADRVDPQKLLRPFLMLTHEHGWRLSAWRQLWASDIDLRPWKDPTTGFIWPHGRIRKRKATDKKGKGDWNPMSPRSQKAAKLLLKRSAAIGDTYLFRAPVAAGPWQEQHALDLLHRTEAYASEVLGEPIELGGFHALRRKWATDRKGMEIVDVAAAGDWHPATVLRYQKKDSETTLRVVMGGKK